MYPQQREPNKITRFCEIRNKINRNDWSFPMADYQAIETHLGQLADSLTEKVIIT